MAGNSRSPEWTLNMMKSSDDDDMRTIIELPEVDRERLDALCRQRGLSRAEGVRQALRHWIDRQTPHHEAVFGLWRNHDETALDLERALREEWSQ